MRTPLGTALVVLALGCALPDLARAQACDLSEENKAAAADAFNDMLPVLRHPRCANCHGALNLYEPSPNHPGGSIVEEVKQDPADDLFSFGGEPTTTTVTRGAEYCAGCHGKAQGQWTQKSPDSEIQWAHLDDRALWKRLQTTRIVTNRSTLATADSTGAGLIGHVEHDLLIALAFDGERAISDELRIYFNFKRDPPPLSKDRFIDALERWVDALDARETWPEDDCSSVLDEYGEPNEPTAVATPPAPPIPPQPGPTPTETETAGTTPPEPGADEPEEGETVTVDPCEGPRFELAAADERIAAGDLGVAETMIAAIDAGECVEVAEAIPDRTTDIAARVDDAVAKINKAGDSCDAAAMDAAALEAGGVSHPRIEEAEAALTRVSSSLVAAEDAYARGKAAFERGDWGAARSDLRAAKARWESAGSACSPQVQRVDVGISKVDRVAGAEAEVAAAVAACDLDLMAAQRQQLQALESPHPRQVALARRITSDIETCKANDPVLQQAAADADCKSDYGSGYSADKRAADGSYFCLPDKATANAWCNANNQGSGWVAGKIKYNGTFDCRLSKTGRNSWCRSKYGGGWRSGSMRSDGSFDCLGPPAATSQTPQTPTHDDASSAAAAAAAAAAIIQGIIQSQGGGSGQNCHRNPVTGQMHCDSN